MAARTRLDAVELLDAWRDVSSVLSEHASALDRLEAGDDWAGQVDAPIGGPVVAPVDRPLAGADLSATIAGAVAAVSAPAGGTSSLAVVGSSLVDGARRCAGGPAGRSILAVLEGMAESLRNADHLDGTRLAIGLELGAERLAPSDDGGHRGRMPAVVAAAADGALAAIDDGAELADVVLAAADDGLVELETGPASDPDLADRGVVDAAAAGFLLVLDVLAGVVTGEPLPAAPVEPTVPTGPGRHFEIRCRVEPHPGCGIESADWLERTWHELGDIVRFEVADMVWHAAIVTGSPGAVIEALEEVGRARELHIGLAPDA